MATNYSKFLELQAGSARTVDLSNNSNILTLGGGGLQFNGSTSGLVVIAAAATTSTYSLVWPAAQAASSGYVLSNDGTGVLSWIASASGSVTAVSVNTANGFAGTSSGGSTPALTLSTTVTGILYGNGTSVATAIVANFPTLNQNTTGTAANVTATSNSTLTTLSSLSLPTSQLSGTITGAQMLPLATNDIYVGNGSNQPAAVAMSGDATIASSGALTLATVATAGTTGSSTAIPVITINAKGLTTSVTTAAVVAPAGTLSGTTLNSTVVSSSLTSLGIQSEALNMGSNQINDLASPSASTDAATKGYVDAAISGLTWQGPAQAYAASNVPLTGSTPLVVDGYTVLNGDLLILANQSTASQNGEYTAAVTGGTYALTANGLPTQAGDAWLILNGTTYADSAFVATAAVPAAEFIEFAGPTSYIFSAPLVLTGNTVSITQASGSANGYLSSTDWNTFNNKQPAGSYITALTGDATASGPGSAPLTLATVNSNTGTFASVTVNGKGLVTAAAALSGDATTSGSTLTLATVNTNTGSFGSSTSIPTFTVNGKGLITAASGNAVVAPAGTLSGTTLNSTVVSSSLTSVGTIATGVWNGTAIGPTFGGTGQTTYTTGDTLYASATNTLSTLGIGTTGQVLTVAAGVPSWASPAISGTVTSVSVVSTNGFAGTVATATTTPAITISTTITAPVLAGNGTAISAATTTGTGSTVVLSASPALTGTVTAVNATLSGNLIAPTLQVTGTYNGAATLSANTTYAMRWGVPANSETAGDLYVADWNTASFDLFWVVGLYNSTSTTATGASITITSKGEFTLGSSDTPFGSTDQGKPVWLGSAGAITANSGFSPSSGDANEKLGIAMGANTIFVDCQMMGVS